MFSSSWLWLYFDSVHQRRKAESLIADLKLFPFASAGFLEVQELASRHGGAAVQQLPPLQLPQPGVPFLDSQGKISIPRISGGPTCTVQDCTFEIWIKTRLARLPLERRAAELLYTALPYLGIRSWILCSRFEVRRGKLEESSTTVVEVRHGTLGSYEGLVPFGYEVVSAGGSLRLIRPRLQLCCRLSACHGISFECPPSASCTNLGRSDAACV